MSKGKDTPAIKKAKRVYFIDNGNKLRERPKTTLPIVFNRDLALIQHPNKTTRKLRPGRDHRTGTRQEMLEGINIKDRESCLRVTD